MKFTITTAVLFASIIAAIGCAKETDLSQYAGSSSTSLPSTSPTPTPTPSSAPVTTLTLAPATAKVTLSGTDQLTASGGVAPYTYSITAPATGGGTISTTGLFTAPATAMVVTADVTDSKGSIATTMIIVEAISLKAAAATVLDGGTDQMTAGGGIGAYTYKIISPATGGGTISTTGLYTAPATVTAATSVTISVADTQGDSVVAVVTVEPAKVLECTGTYSFTFDGSSIYTLTLAQSNVTTGAFTGTLSFVIDIGGFAGANGEVTEPLTGTCTGGKISFTMNASPTTELYSGTYAVSGNTVVIAGKTTYTTSATTYTWSGTSTTAPVYGVE